MYVDNDGDLILETITEIELWLQEEKYECDECRKEGEEMVQFFRSDPRKNPTKIVFAVRCIH